MTADKMRGINRSIAIADMNCLKEQQCKRYIREQKNNEFSGSGHYQKRIGIMDMA
jgi:hypothetical protein